jgi:hypothetical protein
MGLVGYITGAVHWQRDRRCAANVIVGDPSVQAINPRQEDVKAPTTGSPLPTKRIWVMLPDVPHHHSLESFRDQADTLAGCEQLDRHLSCALRGSRFMA